MVEYKIDKTDRRILQMLEENARISVKDIAEANFMSSPAVANRIRRMEANNLIKHYYADIDYPSMGYVVKAFINLEVKPEDKSEFYPFIEKIPNVIQCDCVTGDYSMLIQAAYQRPEELDHLVNELQKFGRTKTEIAFSTPIEHRPIRAKTESDDEEDKKED